MKIKYLNNNQIRVMHRTKKDLNLNLIELGLCVEQQSNQGYAKMKDPNLILMEKKNN